jgi:uncharacterized Ntn-hydrolase superfamily protein
MTYSIVGRDAETGELGVGVQSHFFGAGKVVPWARAGVGALASQALVNPHYGAEGIALMEAGMDPAEAVEALTAADPAASQRQLAMVDADGRAAVFTGADCYPECADATGPGVVAQGNMLRDAGIPAAMVEAFGDAAGRPLAERLLAALEVAEARGGDSRGSQSAGLLVVGGDREESPGTAVRVDLRVEDHPDPIGELGRLVGLDATYSGFAGPVWQMGVVSGEPTASRDDVEAALDALDAAIAALPEVAEPLMWRTIVLARSGRAAEAQAAMEASLRLNPELEPFFAKLRGRGIVPGSGPVGAAKGEA